MGRKSAACFIEILFGETGQKVAGFSVSPVPIVVRAGIDRFLDAQAALHLPASQEMSCAIVLAITSVSIRPHSNGFHPQTDAKPGTAAGARADSAIERPTRLH
jgi:hypothetical protein